MLFFLHKGYLTSYNNLSFSASEEWRAIWILLHLHVLFKENILKAWGDLLWGLPDAINRMFLGVKLIRIWNIKCGYWSIKGINSVKRLNSLFIRKPLTSNNWIEKKQVITKMLCYSNFLKLILCTLPIFVKSFIYFNLPNSIVHVPCSTVHGTKTQHIWRCFFKNNWRCLHYYHHRWTE